MKLNGNSQGFGNSKKGFGLKKSGRRMPVAYRIIFGGVILALFLLVCFLPLELKVKTAVFFCAIPLLAFGGVFAYNVISKKRK